MSNVDMGGASVGSLLLVGQLMEQLIKKNVLTTQECTQAIHDAAALAQGPMATPVKDAFKTAFPQAGL